MSAISAFIGLWLLLYFRTRWVRIVGALLCVPLILAVLIGQLRGGV